MKASDTINLIYAKGVTEDYWREDYPHSAKEPVEYVRKDIADELAGALGNLIELSDDHSPFGGEIYQDRVRRVWENARAALARYGERERQRYES